MGEERGFNEENKLDIKRKFTNNNIDANLSNQSSSDIRNNSKGLDFITNLTRIKIDLMPIFTKYQKNQPKKTKAKSLELILNERSLFGNSFEKSFLLYKFINNDFLFKLRKKTIMDGIIFFLYK